MMRKYTLYILLLVVGLLVAMPSISRAGEVRLMFPNIEVTEEKSADGKSWIVVFKKEQYAKNEYMEVGLSQFVKELESQDYQVDHIELWVEGRAESGGVSRLFISTDGQRGYKVILKPRQR
jgi:hypothetical protein